LLDFGKKESGKMIVWHGCYRCMLVF
jgi:hypothetical protein